MVKCGIRTNIHQITPDDSHGEDGSGETSIVKPVYKNLDRLRKS